MVDNILIIGGGSRENVITQKLIESRHDVNIFLYNCYYSIRKMYKDFNITENYNKNNLWNIKYIFGSETCDDIINKCIENSINIVVPGSEKYLEMGITNELDKYNIKCYGPTKVNARLESDKNYGKQIMKKYNIPYSSYKTFSKSEYTDCINYISKKAIDGGKYVIKKNNLASGKGVYIPNSYEESIEIINNIVNIDGNTVLIEDKLEGDEVSLMGFCNGKEIIFSPQSSDYKRKNDDNLGVNTGGMGSICPVNKMKENDLALLKEKLDKLVAECKYIGVLYVAIMFEKKNNYDKFRVIEFNCRLGDPETQVVLGCLKTDFYEVIKKSINMENLELAWDIENKYINVVVASEDYSETSLLKHDINLKFNNFIARNINASYNIYFGNVKLNIDNKYVSTGGRIFSICMKGKTWNQCHFNIYNALLHLNIDNIYYRRDIARSITFNNNYNKKLNNDETLFKKQNIAILCSSQGRSIHKLLTYAKTSKYINIGVIISNKKKAKILDISRDNAINNLYINGTNYSSREEYDKTLVDILRSFDIDIVLLVGYDRIVTSILVNEFKENIVNIHPSLLPKYGGKMDLDIHKQVIKDNEKYSGCTLHIVSEGVDEGPIILQSQLAINNIRHSEILKTKIQHLEWRCIMDYLYMKVASNINFKYNVNIELGNKFVENLKSDNKYIGGFCSFYKYNDDEWGTCCDGVGTKLDLAIKCNKLDGIGIDLVAMNVNDLLVCGVKPLYFLDYIAIDNMNLDLCNKIIASIKEGCKLANCDLVGGETAEMKCIYRHGKFDLAGFSSGIVINKLPKLNMINGTSVLYGIKSSGVHSNGYTLVNKLLKNNSNLNDIVNELGLLEPTRIYTELLEIYERYGILIGGAVHITGGGFKDNITRILPEGYSYELNKLEFSDVFKWIQTQGNLSYDEMINIYNCGIGIVLVMNTMTMNTKELNKMINDYDLIKIGKIIKN